MNIWDLIGIIYLMGVFVSFMITLFLIPIGKPNQTGLFILLTLYVLISWIGLILILIIES